jgi:hypothetical protein
VGWSGPSGGQRGAALTTGGRSGDMGMDRETNATEPEGCTRRKNAV